jgi:hypothetical protein
MGSTGHGLTESANYIEAADRQGYSRDTNPISGGSFLSAVLAQAGPSLLKYNRKTQRLGPMNNWTEHLSSAKVSTEVG